MRIFSAGPNLVKESKSQRIVEKDSLRDEKFNYSDKIAADPRMKKYAPPDISAAEVRKKLQDHKLKQEQEMAAVIAAKATANAAKKEQMVKDVETGKELEKPSDVSLNNPKDPATVGKLKEALNVGTFNFSTKEREVLTQILSRKE